LSNLSRYALNGIYLKHSNVKERDEEGGERKDYRSGK
jgi:hypothetical protein